MRYVKEEMFLALILEGEDGSKELTYEAAVIG